MMSYIAGFDPPSNSANIFSEERQKDELAANSRRLDQECRHLARLLALTILILAVLVALIFSTFLPG